MRTMQYLEHEVPDTPVELGPVVVPLSAQPEKVLRHARHDVAVYLDVDVSLRGLQLAIALVVASVRGANVDRFAGEWMEIIRSHGRVAHLGPCFPSLLTAGTGQKVDQVWKASDSSTRTAAACSTLGGGNVACRVA